MNQTKEIQYGKFQDQKEIIDISLDFILSNKYEYGPDFEDKEKEYIQSVIKADFQEAGDEDVFRKIKEDLKDHSVSDEDIRNKMKELDEKAKSDFI